MDRSNKDKEFEKLRRLIVETLDEDDDFELQDSEDSYKPSESSSSSSESEDVKR